MSNYSVLYHALDEDSHINIGTELYNCLISKYLMNKLFLKHKLRELKMVEESNLRVYINFQSEH